jgi:hypothetical protein
MGRFDDEQRVTTAPIRHPHADVAQRERDGRSAEQRILQLQQQAGNAGVAQLLRDESDADAVQQLVSRGGQPLDEATRGEMESAFGEDFGDVRVHTGDDASASAQRLGARAYTVGDDVVFGSGAYEPGSETGRHTLAHELTHVVQQRSGPVDGEETGTGVKVSDPGDRFERAAEETATRVTSGETATDVHAGAAPPTAQREGAAEDELEEDVQGMWLQRQEEMEDEVPEEA